MKQIDERTIMFARMNLKPGSWEYEDYYKTYPEHKGVDDHLRSMPNLCSEGTAMYSPLTAPIADSDFQIISHLHSLCEGDVSMNKVSIEPAEATVLVKKLMIHYGADKVAITRLKEEHYYSIRGRQSYGSPVKEHHRYAVVFIKEMEKDQVNRAPKMEGTIETSDRYLKLAVMGLQLATYLRNNGYPARNHMDGN